jgi:hypothetical protein
MSATGLESSQWVTIERIKPYIVYEMKKMLPSNIVKNIAKHAGG